MTKKATVAIPFGIVSVLLIGMVLAGEESDSSQPKAVIRSPSSVGEVVFPHKLHFEELEIECDECHHETDAAKLQMPHEEYFEDFWIDCRICHNDNEVVSKPQACANCHHNSPANNADQTLSAKVVIHKNCWECHDMETGEEASQNCIFCHSQTTAVSPAASGAD